MKHYHPFGGRLCAILDVFLNLNLNPNLCHHILCSFASHEHSLSVSKYFFADTNSALMVCQSIWILPDQTADDSHFSAHRGSATVLSVYVPVSGAPPLYTHSL